MRQLQTINSRQNPLREFRTELDRFFDDFWGTGNQPQTGRFRESEWAPTCDIREGEDHYLISMDVPGIPQDQIKLEVHDHRLSVSGERTMETNGEDDDRVYTERSYGRFERMFTLPDTADTERLEAQYENGVLRVLVPKAEVSKPRQIKIQQGTGTGLFGKLMDRTRMKGKESLEKH